MEIPLFNLKKEHEELWDEFLPVLHSIFKRAEFILGKEVRDFEEWLRDFTGTDYALGCASGTDAIRIALMSLDLEPEAEVAVPAFTFFATAEVPALLGHKLTFIDIEEKYFTMDPEDLQQKMSDRIKVIIVVHLYGQCANMEKIVEIARKNNCLVIEDVAQAMGAECTINGLKKKAGSMGDAGCFSFFPTKNLGGWGDGGALTTSNKELAEKMKSIAIHGQKEKKNYHYYLGLNSRLDTIQAALLLLKARKITGVLARKREIAEIYRHYLSSVEEIELPQEAPWASHTYHLYTVKVLHHRDALMEYLHRKGIGCGVYYPLSLPEQEAFRNMGYRNECEKATRVARKVLSLPMHRFLTEKEVATIAEAIKHFFTSKEKK